jgi:hypothetical protein
MRQPGFASKENEAMKTYALAAAALALMSGTALAAPGYYSHHKGGLTPKERAAIARSAAHLAALKHRAWADGRLTAFERMRIRMAELQHRRLIARELRD